MYYIFSDQLKGHYNTGQFWIEVEVEDLASFDAVIAEKLQKLPSEHLPLVKLLFIVDLCEGPALNVFTDIFHLIFLCTVTLNCQETWFIGNYQRG